MYSQFLFASLLTSLSLAQPNDSLERAQLIIDYALDRRDTILLGNIDHRGKADTAFIEPYVVYYSNGAIDSQYTNMTFSCGLPTLRHDNGFFGLLVAVGDLDGNGIDELLYYPDWYQSNWAGIFVYSCSRGLWKLLGTGSVFRPDVDGHKNPTKYLRSLVQKKNAYSFTITSSEWNADGDRLVKKKETFPID